LLFAYGYRKGAESNWFTPEAIDQAIENRSVNTV
jgi:hypothetical protein